MPHTVNTVPALQEGNILKRPHDVIPKGRKSRESYGAEGTKVRCLNIQPNAFFAKMVISDCDPISAVPIIRVGEQDMECLCIRNKLYGTEVRFSGFMNRGNDGKRLVVGLAAKIPAAEKVSHMRASDGELESMIPIFATILCTEHVTAVPSNLFDDSVTINNAIRIIFCTSA